MKDKGRLIGDFDLEKAKRIVLEEFDFYGTNKSKGDSRYD